MRRFRFGLYVFVAIALGIGGAARADDPAAFELLDHGAVVEVGPGDPWHASLSVVSRPALVDDVRGDQVQVEDIVLLIDGAHSFPLGRLTRWRRDDGMEILDGVRQESVKYGVFDGRPDLLLVVWSAYGLPGAGGFYAECGCMIVSLGLEPAVVLRSLDRVGGSIRHVDELTSRWFGIDAETGDLIERVDVRHRRVHERPTPLGRHELDEGGEAVWRIDVHAVAERRIRPEGDAWRPEGWVIRYEGKAGDTFSEISAYFLGPIGTLDTIRRMNPDFSTTAYHLSQDSPVRLPIPSQWIDDSIGSEILMMRADSRAPGEKTSDEQPIERAPE